MAEGAVRGKRSPVITACIELLSSEHADRPLIVAAARSIEADALYNQWLYKKKASATDEELMAELERYDQLCERLDAAVTSCLANPSPDHHSRLLSALHHVQALARASGPLR